MSCVGKHFVIFMWDVKKISCQSSNISIQKDMSYKYAFTVKILEAEIVMNQPNFSALGSFPAPFGGRAIKQLRWSWISADTLFYYFQKFQKLLKLILEILSMAMKHKNIRTFNRSGYVSYIRCETISEDSLHRTHSVTQEHFFYLKWV